MFRFFDRRGEKGDHQIGIGVRSHQSRHQLGGRGIAAVLPGIGNDRVGQAMLVIDGDDGQPLLVPDVASERLEVGDHQIDLPSVDEVLETARLFAACGCVIRFFAMVRL